MIAQTVHNKLRRNKKRDNIDYTFIRVTESGSSKTNEWFYLHMSAAQIISRNCSRDIISTHSLHGKLRHLHMKKATDSWFIIAKATDSCTLLHKVIWF